VKIPAGVDDLTVRKKLLKRFRHRDRRRAGRLQRQGLGASASWDTTPAPAASFQVLAALEQCLGSVGCKVTPGAGIAAANKVLRGLVNVVLTLRVTTTLRQRC